MARVIIDTNLWSVFAKSGGTKQLFNLARQAGVDIAMPPSILLELIRTKDRAMRHVLADGLRAGKSIKLKTEAQVESNEIVGEVRRCRPDWMRQIANTGVAAGYETFWTKKIWKATPEQLDRLYEDQERDLGARMNAQIMQENREQWLREKFPSSEMVRADFQVEWPGAPEWFCEVVPRGHKADFWRVSCVIDFWREFSTMRNNALLGGKPSTYVDWVSPYVNIDRMTADPVAFTDFWINQVKVENLPRQWIRQYGEMALSQFKVTPGHPYDNQHMVYLLDCDAFLTADKRFVDAVSLLRPIAPFKIPPLKRVVTPANDIQATIDSITLELGQLR